VKLPKATIISAALAATLLVPVSADALTTKQLVKKAGSNPRRCDHDRNHRWGQTELKCVIIVVMPHRWERWGLRVAKCESGGDHYVADPPPTPPYGAAGLFQFLPSTWRTTPQYKALYRAARRRGSSPSRARRYAARKVGDPVVNTRAARWLVQTSGPSQWTCR